MIADLGVSGECFYPKQPGYKNRRLYLTILGVFAFLWLITFFVLATKWGQDLTQDIPDGSYGTFGPKAGIVFSLFSIATWVKYYLITCYDRN